MKKNLIIVALLAGSAFASTAIAAAGSVHFTGFITEEPCEVVTKDQTVNLGGISKDEFPVAGATSAGQKFNLKLTNCPITVTTAAVRFEGDQYGGNNNEILALTQETGVATGVGIQLRDNQNQLVKLLENSSSYPLQPTVDNELDFSARYVSAIDTVNAGPANGVVQFSIVYP